MSSLKINNLNKVFPSGEAGLYNVSLEAEDKEFLVSRAATTAESQPFSALSRDLKTLRAARFI